MYIKKNILNEKIKEVLKLRNQNKYNNLKFVHFKLVYIVKEEISFQLRFKISSF